MALLSLWTRLPDGNWTVKLVDPTSLPQAPPPKPPPPPPRPPGTDYTELARQFNYRARAWDYQEKEARDWSQQRNRKLNTELQALATRIQQAQDFTLTQYAHQITDHDFIQAMFNLYSQQRSRLLL